MSDSIPSPAPGRRARVLPLAAVVGVVLLGAVGGGWWWWRGGKEEASPLDQPRLQAGVLPAGSLYYNPVALPWLLTQRPELVPAAERDGQAERARLLAQAVQEPKLFRRLDRETRFETVLLVGDPSQFRALLDHLVETRDFRLRHVDHTCLIFRRQAAAAWRVEDFATVRQAMAGASRRKQATVLAQAGAKLAAAGETEAARQLLEEAAALDAGSVEVWSARGVLALEQHDWPGALKATERALSTDKKHLGALSTRIQAFVSTKRFNEAYSLSQKLLAIRPEDPHLLFKHAQVAHEAGAFKTEIAALEKLIALAEAGHQPTAGYRFYLAQAHTAAGNAQPALENFATILKDPELPADQRTFALETIERIKKRTGL